MYATDTATTAGGASALLASAAAAAIAAAAADLDAALSAAVAAAADGQPDDRHRLAAVDAVLALAQMADAVAATGGAAGIADRRCDIAAAAGDAIAGICRADAGWLPDIGRRFAQRLAKLLRPEVFGAN